MTLSQAIEMLERIVAQDEESGRLDCVKAERLGIEALKRVKECGHPARCGLLERLPGETEE